MGSGPLCDIRHAVRSPGQPPVREADAIEPELRPLCKAFARKNCIFTKNVVHLPQLSRLAVTCLL